MTDPEPDFDVEKRRRWYAASIGAAGATGLIAMFFLQIWRDGTPITQPEPLWQTIITIFAFWLFFFALKYVAAYALWYRPYSTPLRAVAISLLAIFSVYIAMTVGGILFSAFRGSLFNFRDSVTVFVKFHQQICGLPYITAAIIGWVFAKKSPDVREQF